MTRRIPALAAALLLAALAPCGGCAGQFSPDRQTADVQRLTAANVGYAAAVRTLTALRTAGKIDDATALRIEAGRKLAEGFLADAKRAVTTGDRQTFDRTLAAFDAALADLDRAANLAKSGVPTNGT